ncbi:MAG: hypothetical protein EPN85_14270 [Bacteroidetes bacterium]|nr:MAG: hypothetical protein EPN85_14270 [Bacteroidota bacterium]
MDTTDKHTFHIPVMGLAYTIDSPVKVARYGISSVISIIEDHLIERMREFHSADIGEKFAPISINEPDYRAKRIREYLNLIQRIVNKQVADMRKQNFSEGTDIVKYFKMLPDKSPSKQMYLKMIALPSGTEKESLQEALCKKVMAGSIDVNIMTKCDRMNHDKDGTLLPAEFADAMSALRGFATSDLSSSVVFSAGMNPRLYSYCETFNDFLPDKTGNAKKKIILKVSDFRSALIQGKILAKKGLWISEFRIESGLNCGGHAFPTEGFLLGPILQEFHEKRQALSDELYKMCNEALTQKGKESYASKPVLKITVQGGIGTAAEDKFLLKHYELDGTGWGSPFLLVPEATNVDDETLQQLATAKQEDYYLSHASPLCIPFNNFRKSSSEKQRHDRIDRGRPGSPCYKKYLAFNTEFTTEPICSASREYQNLKIKSLKEKNLPEEVLKKEIESIVEKDCLCEGLGAAVLIKNHLTPAHELNAVNICPGPNLAYFSGIFSLNEMVNHIYGRTNILNSLRRSNLFVNELKMYADYLKNEMDKNVQEFSLKKNKYLSSFKNNLIEGIGYYKNLIPQLKHNAEIQLGNFMNDLACIETKVMELSLPEPVEAQ